MWELIGNNILLQSILLPAEQHLVTGAPGAKSQGLTDPLGLVQNLRCCGKYLVPADLVVMQTLVVRPTKDAQKVPVGNKRHYGSDLGPTTSIKVSWLKNV